MPRISSSTPVCGRGWPACCRRRLIAGKPVVSYDVDGAREVAIPGETGYLLPPKSVDELAAALSELAGNPALRERLGRTGRERFTEQFRHETMTRRIREVYAQVLGVE